MKILVIGEYSGFAKNLKIGLKKIGHDVIVFSWGDLFKKIKSDFPEDYYINATNFRIGKLELKKTWILKYIFESFSFKRKVRSISKNGLFDAVLVLNLDFVRSKNEFWKPFFSMKMINNVVKNPDNIFLSLCGNDLVYNSYLPHFRKFNPDDEALLESTLTRNRKVYKEFSSYFKKVIPVMYDYAEPYRKSELGKKFSIQPTIPLPLCLDNIEYYNEVGDEIVIFYGLNKACKGTAIITEALNIIGKKFDNVEVIIDGHMPLNIYLNVIRRANIIVDQCYAFSYGMNAIYSMAMGKVVLSGNEPECQLEFKRNDIPIVNIEPNVNQIVSQIENLINDPCLIKEISLKTRVFAENFHESAVVAQQYVDIFKKNNDLVN